MLIRAADALSGMSSTLAVIGGPLHVVEVLGPAARRSACPLAVGRPVRDCLPIPDAETVVDAVKVAYDTGRPTVAGGASLGCLPVWDDDGKVAGVLLHVVDEGFEPDIDRALARGAALQRLAAELAQAGSSAEIARLAVTAGAELSEADAAAVYVHPVGSGALELVHARGWPPEAVQRFGRVVLQAGRPLSDSVLNRVPVWLEDPEQWRARYPAVAEVGTSHGYDATACLPLMMEDRVVGALAYSFAQPRPLPPAEREYLEAVAAVCAQALDRVRLSAAERAVQAASERQLRWMTFLARVGPLLEAPLSVEQRLQRLADVAAAEIADWCAVHLVRNDRVEQVAVAHADPQKVAFVARLQQRYPPSPATPGGAVEVSRTGKASYMPDISDELLVEAGVDPEHLELIRSIGMRSAVVVPLLVRGRSLGALTLVQAESGRRFDQTEIAFVQQLGSSAALALDNARLYEQRRHVADTLQTALLPTSLPEVPGLRLAARYQPCSVDEAGIAVGGDFYDVIATARPGRWAVTIGDVCGKGPAAAALTAMLRHTVRSEVRHGYGPKQVLRRLNAAILHDSAERVARFATVVHAHVQTDPSGADVAVVNAGHLPPLVLRQDRVETVHAPGSLLGVYPDVDLTQQDVRLDAGDALVLHTDGITEARGSERFYGEERLRAVVSSCAGHCADAIADAVLGGVSEFDGGRHSDDIALVVVQAAP
jgi:serine phosphatase RsbU (regulator of sigma subunit)